MQIEITEVEPCKLNVQYVADAGEILDKRAEVLSHFKKAPVKGFRPGKATLDAIKVYYRDQIEEALKRALIEDAYHNTIFEKKLRPHGAPRFNSHLMADGKFTCEFSMCVKPEFDLASYKNLEIPKPHETTNAVELTEKMLQDLRMRCGEVSHYSETDVVAVGDNVIVDYDGSINGEAHPNLSAQGEMITVGNSQLLEFDHNIVGMMLGETKEFDLVVPETGLPSLAGKTVHFKVSVSMGSKTVPHPLDDELAKKVGKKDYQELRASLNEVAMAKVVGMQRTELNKAISARLVRDNSFEVPPWLSLSEAQYLVHQAKLDWNLMPDEDKEKYLEMAAGNVKLSLILDRLREVEPEAQLSDQEVFEIVKQNIINSKVKTPIDDVIKEMNKTGYLQILFSRIKDEYALDFVVKTSKVIE